MEVDDQVVGAAVLVAVQLTAVHWFYLYVPWFAPLVLVGLFAPLVSPASPARVSVGRETVTNGSDNGGTPVAAATPALLRK